LPGKSRIDLRLGLILQSIFRLLLMMVLSQQLGRSGGHPSGFDYLRLGLAVSILIWHGPLICWGEEQHFFMWEGAFRAFSAALVPAFFVLSGFLVAGSLERNTVPAFIALRVIRIFPALVAEVLLSALVIGPLVTTLPLAQYFSHPDFFRYLLNSVGDIHFYLPGVFEQNPTQWVNIQLWTVPAELNCYLTLVALSLVGIVWRPKWLLAATILLGAVLPIWWQMSGSVSLARWPTVVLVLCFLLGVSAFRLRDHIPYSPIICAVSGALYLILSSHPKISSWAAFPLAYVVIRFVCLPVSSAWWGAARSLYCPAVQCCSAARLDEASRA
jgi:peptidoglycan/LPS O-acetylase OafA/YrhL